MTSLVLTIFSSLIIGALPDISVCEHGCDSATIRSALAEAQDGQVVLVKSGRYQEGPLLVSRSIELRGEGEPILIGDGSDSILTVRADNVGIQGLTFIDSGESYLQELAAIKVEDARNCRIVRNKLRNNAYGVYLAQAEGCSIEHNAIEGTRKSESEAGNGVHIWNGRANTISHNLISGHRDGIYLEFSKDGAVSDNHVRGNVRYGLHFMSSDRNVYTHNIFEQNGAGVAVMYSHYITMRENQFRDNRGMAAYGLLLKDISRSVIARNFFGNNTFGIYMESTLRSHFEENQFELNGYGIRVYGDCEDNTFNHNNFMGNTFNVTTNSSRNPNLFEENYWSDYDGYDLNQDGVGDLPFRPVSFASTIVGSLDSSFVLIKSFFFLVMNQIEQAFPQLIPESLKDARPLMRPRQWSHT